MKRAHWCTCGCGRRPLITMLSPRAAGLMNRRRREERKAAVLAQQAAIAQALARHRQLAMLPHGGNA